MSVDRLPVYFVVSVVIIIAVMSGPGVAGIDFATKPPSDESSFCEASGNATITVDSVPEDSFALRQRWFGAGAFYLSAGETEVSVESPTGCPIVVYRLTIDELNYFGQRLYFINQPSDKNLGLRVVEGTFTPSEMKATSYAGTITIRLRGNETRTIYRTNVTIPVKK